MPKQSDPDIEHEVRLIEEFLVTGRDTSESRLGSILDVEQLNTLLREAYPSITWRRRLWRKVYLERIAERQSAFTYTDLDACLVEFIDQAVDLWVQGQEILYPASEDKAVHWMARIIKLPASKDP